MRTKGPIRSDVIQNGSWEPYSTQRGNRANYGERNGMDAERNPNRNAKKIWGRIAKIWNWVSWETWGVRTNTILRDSWRWSEREGNLRIKSKEKKIKNGHIVTEACFGENKIRSKTTRGEIARVRDRKFDGISDTITEPKSILNCNCVSKVGF